MNNFAKRIAVTAATALVSVALVSPLQAQDAHKHGDAKPAAPADKAGKAAHKAAMQEKMSKMHGDTPDAKVRQDRMEQMHEGMKAGKKPADAKPGLSKDGEHKH